MKVKSEHAGKSLFSFKGGDIKGQIFVNHHDELFHAYEQQKAGNIAAMI
ncbi:hypothetical protein VSK92_00080 [Bacillus swezeyi]